MLGNDRTKEARSEKTQAKMEEAVDVNDPKMEDDPLFTCKLIE